MIHLPPFCPSEVREAAEELQTASGGIIPTVEATSPRHWLITVTGDRVQTTMTLKRTPYGRIRWAGATLTVDGKPRELVADSDELAKIFADPDGTQPPAATVDPIPEPCPVGRAPMLVQHHYHQLVSALPDDKTDLVQVGRRGNRWTIGLDLPRGAVRVNLVRKGSQCAFGRPPIQVVIDGIDRSDEVRDDLAKALSLMTGPPSAPAAGASDGTPAQADRVTPMASRRGTVMRN